MLLEIIGWIAMGGGVIGALLVTSQKRHIRLIAFCIWVATNSYWAIFGGTTSLQVMFAIYLLLCILGIKNNLPTKEA